VAADVQEVRVVKIIGFRSIRQHPESLGLMQQVRAEVIVLFVFWRFNKRIEIALHFEFTLHLAQRTI
jgi:hypothetical protein